MGRGGWAFKEGIETAEERAAWLQAHAPVVEEVASTEDVATDGASTDST